MNVRKHNSFLLLTTLGVYLGLVLVGAPTGILGHPAAMTRDFDIKDEIEFSERLDNDPDDLLGESIADLFKDLDKLAKSGEFDWTQASEFSTDNLSFSAPTDSHSFLGFGGVPGSKPGTKIEQTSLLIARRLLTEKVSVGACTLDLKYKFENTGVSLDIPVNTNSATHAGALAASLDEYLNTVSNDVKSKGRQIVIANTRSKVEDTRVIISTHLARSDISDILA